MHSANLDNPKGTDNGLTRASRKTWVLVITDLFQLLRERFAEIRASRHRAETGLTWRESARCARVYQLPGHFIQVRPVLYRA